MRFLSIEHDLAFKASRLYGAVERNEDFRNKTLAWHRGPEGLRFFLTLGHHTYVVHFSS